MSFLIAKLIGWCKKILGTTFGCKHFLSKDRNKCLWAEFFIQLSIDLWPSVKFSLVNLIAIADDFGHHNDEIGRPEPVSASDGLMGHALGLFSSTELDMMANSFVHRLIALKLRQATSLGKNNNHKICVLIQVTAFLRAPNRFSGRCFSSKMTGSTDEDLLNGDPLVDEQGKIRLNPNQTTRLPQPTDVPYAHYTKEQQEYYWKGYVQSRAARSMSWMDGDHEKYDDLLAEDGINPIEEPYSHIYEGVDDKGFYSKAEVVSDPNVWFWVQRLFPREPLPHDNIITSENPEYKPSGWKPASKTAPALAYFVPRTRGGLLPVYKKLFRRDTYKDKKRVIWRKIWVDHIPEREPEVATVISRCDGDPRELEKDVRGFLEHKYQKKILSAVNESTGHLTLKGNWIFDVVKYLEDKGFWFIMINI